MSIKSDKWIRRMAEKHGMIEPFEPNQIKEANGQRIISYGTSSYGYDIRCANEFKIFTNINSTIVDPKNFDPKNFVTVEDDCCIIPPNSFALARTVEYFRMGRRNVDGYRMYYNPDLLADLFDASEVFDSSRPTPVPPMNGG